MSEFTFAKRTLMSGGHGFHFATPPPVDVAHSKQFQHPKPEPTIYAVLARAQHGDFGAFAELLRVMYEHDDAWVWGVCTELLSHAAPASLLRQLPELLRTPRDAVDPEDVDRDANAQWCIEILSLSNYAWTIPKILDLYRGIGDKQRFGSGCFMLSRLLEPEFGPIFEGPKRVPRDPDD